MDTLERLLSKVKIDGGTGCWNWLGCKLNTGYGQIWAGGRARSTHRLSFELHRGVIPAGMNICHRCDNRLCINPDHMFLGTNAENMADKVSKGRQARGESIAQSKLTEEDVIAIRASKGISQTSIAKQFGVSHDLIALVRSRKIWRHV